MPIIIVPDPFNLRPPAVIYVKDLSPLILGAMVGAVVLFGLGLLVFLN